MKVKNHVAVRIDKNGFEDRGNGLIVFPNKQTISDNNEQRSGARYDIESLTLDEYNGQVTVDHTGLVTDVVAKVTGIAKIGTQVVIDGLQFAVKESALAKLVYDLWRGGYVTDMSTETYGMPEDEEGVRRNASLIGLSIVTVGDNRSARVNELAMNSISHAKQEGLDTTDAEKLFPEVKVETNKIDPVTVNVTVNNVPQLKDKDKVMFVTVKNSRDFAVKLKYKNAAGSEVETEVPAGGTVDVSEDQKESLETQVKDAPVPTPTAPVPPVEPPKAPETQNNSAFLEQIKSLVDGAVKPLAEKIATVEQNAFDAKAKEPEWKPARNSGVAAMGGGTDTSKYEAMSANERHGLQVNAAWDLLKRKDNSAGLVLQKLNEVNLAELKREKVVANGLTIADFGNFVISRELLTEIEGCRNDYTPLVNATSWKETLSTQFAWLNRQGDINMQNVEFCDDGADGNLKPISEYTATIRTADLEELAAVTPVCNAATRFLAADLLGDVAAGYRNDYDRKRAQLVIARLEQAVESNGNSVVYDTNPNVEALVALLNAYKEIANCTPNGTFIMNTSSHVSIMAYALRAGISGPLSQIFTTGSVPLMFGRPYIVVSDDLMPSLDSASTVSIVVGDTTVTVNHAVFYANLSNFTGRTSGGLQYDLSTEAAYEDNGTVKSAYQRNELVLRGSFFRGGAIKDNNQVAGITAPGVS